MSKPKTAADLDASAITWLWRRGILTNAEAADISKRVLKMEAAIKARAKRKKHKEGKRK